MRTRISASVAMLLLMLVILAGCGSTTTGNAGRAASLAVNAAQVGIEPGLSRIPINQKTRFTIMLTAAGTANQPLQVSLKGADNSYPPQTRGKSLQDAFPGCSDTAILNLDTSTPGINSVQPLDRSLNDNQDSWVVDVTPQATGSLTLDGEIDVKWTCPNGEEIGQYALIRFEQPTTVFDPHPYHTFFGDFLNNNWVITVGGGLLVLILAGAATWAWKRKNVTSATKATPAAQNKPPQNKPAQGTPTQDKPA